MSENPEDLGHSASCCDWWLGRQQSPDSHNCRSYTIAPPPCMGSSILHDHRPPVVFQALFGACRLRGARGFLCASLRFQRDAWCRSELASNETCSGASAVARGAKLVCKAGVLCWSTGLSPSCSASNSASLANAPEKAVEDGSSAWVPATDLGGPDGGGLA